MASRDAIHPVKKRRNKERDESICRDFGMYQVCLLFATQLSYLPVAATILSTNFMKLTPEGCRQVLEARNRSSWVPVNGTTGTTVPEWFREGRVPEGEFLSLFALWGLDCTEHGNMVQTGITLTVMIGGLVGAILSGFVADRYGRKPVVIASLSLLSLSNGLLLLSSFLSWASALPLFFLMGAACGGYMTTNLVLMVESLCWSSSRLLVVALNGWSLSMAGTALLAFMCPHWLQYHVAVAVIAALCALLLFLVADESLRWLKTSHKVTRFDRASSRLIKFNRGAGCKDIALLCQLEKDGAVVPPMRPLVDSEAVEVVVPSPSYIDLFAERSLRPRLFALAYCFFASSIVSFGMYFAIDTLGGNRYANLAIAGVGKFLLGLLPFVVSSCVSRKQVALFSVAVCGIATWTVLACLLAGVPFQSLAIAVLSCVATASLDPNWKISHLYSTELFPTNMRNMARGFCNSLARIGSVVAPAIVHNRHAAPEISIGLFALLLTAQFLITARFLPNKLPSDLQDAVSVAVAIPSERRRKAKRSEYDDQDEIRSRENSSQLSESAPLTP